MKTKKHAQRKDPEVKAAKQNSGICKNSFRIFCASVLSLLRQAKMSSLISGNYYKALQQLTLL